ncbi:MAG: MFS transporter [Methylobacteriaceae bacterium]|jgi:hypothetical protein|nr:MFS transporter [Methylobacteriaceae bacterium]
MNTFQKLAVLFVAAVVLGSSHASRAQDYYKMKMLMRLDTGDVIVALNDSSVSADFAALLPLTAVFKDYAGAEKITYLPRELNTTGAEEFHDVTGDFAYYAPWGNLAVFYKGSGRASGLYILGRIESGKEILAAQKGDFAASLEIIE